MPKISLCTLSSSLERRENLEKVQLNEYCQNYNENLSQFYLYEPIDIYLPALQDFTMNSRTK